MLRLVRWIAYRDQVLEHVGTLLVMYPRGRQFTADYPGLRAVIRAHFDDGASAPASALLVTARLIGDMVRQLSPQQIRLVSTRLRALDLEAMEALIARQISRLPARLEHPVDFTASLVGGALFMARCMAGEGSLDSRGHARFLALLDEILTDESEGRLQPLAQIFALPEPPSTWSSVAGSR